MKNPKRLFRSRREQARARMDAAIGPIPRRVEQLREAHKHIDPARVYRFPLPDGSIYQTTGADMLRTARQVVAMADAHRAGDEDGLRRASLAFLAQG